jgi:hypothetical protein
MQARRRARWMLLGAMGAALAFAPLGGANHLGAVQLGHEHTGVPSMTSVRGFTNQPQFYTTNEWGNGIASIAYAPVGIGLYGIHDAATGEAAGVQGETHSSHTLARGVYGLSTATSPGNFAAGVRGHSNATTSNGVGVYGSQDGSGFGVYGTTPGGNGVRGNSANGTGVFGFSANNTGVFGDGPVYGVRGISPDTVGVNTGVIGSIGIPADLPVTGSDVGVRGSGGFAGVAGRAAGWGLYGDGSTTSGGTFTHGDPGLRAAAAPEETANAIEALGYVKLDARTGAPPATDCDSDHEAGRVIVRTDGTLNLYICLGVNGWVAK